MGTRDYIRNYNIMSDAKKPHVKGMHAYVCLHALNLWRAYCNAVYGYHCIEI